MTHRPGWPGAAGCGTPTVCPFGSGRYAGVPESIRPSRCAAAFRLFGDSSSARCWSSCCSCWSRLFCWFCRWLSVNAFSLIFVLSTRMPSTPATTMTSTSATNGARGTDTGAGGATRRPGLVVVFLPVSGRSSGASAVAPRVTVTGWRRVVVAVCGRFVVAVDVVVMASPSVPRCPADAPTRAGLVQRLHLHPLTFINPFGGPQPYRRGPRVRRDLGVGRQLRAPGQQPEPGPRAGRLDRQGRPRGPPRPDRPPPLDDPVLQRVVGHTDPPPPDGPPVQRRRQRRRQRLELAVDLDAPRLEGALRRVAAGPPGRCRYRVPDQLRQARGRGDPGLRAFPDDRRRDPAGELLLAVHPQDPDQPRGLVGVDHLFGRRARALV